MKTLAQVAAFVIGLWLIVVAAAWAFQARMIYLPNTADPPLPAGGPQAQQVTITTSDGVELAAWLVEHPEPVARVLVANGNAGNRESRWPLAVGLHARGHSVLLVDYRGYGGNAGRPHEAGVVEDIAAAARWLLDSSSESAPIVYYGESLGSAVAAAVAVDHPPAALVLRSPFPSLADVARQHYPLLPVGALLRERHPTAAHLEQVDVPVLVIAGSDDRIVDPTLSRRVAALDGVHYVEIEGADHNDRALLDGDDLLGAVDEFLRIQAN